MILDAFVARKAGNAFARPECVPSSIAHWPVPVFHSRARPSVFDSVLIIYVMISKANHFGADNNMKESGWIDRLFRVPDQI